MGRTEHPMKHFDVVLGTKPTTGARENTVYSFGFVLFCFSFKAGFFFCISLPVLKLTL